MFEFVNPYFHLPLKKHSYIVIFQFNFYIPAARMIMNSIPCGGLKFFYHRSRAFYFENTFLHYNSRQLNRKYYNIGL